VFILLRNSYQGRTGSDIAEKPFLCRYSEPPAQKAPSAGRRPRIKQDMSTRGCLSSGCQEIEEPRKRRTVGKELLGGFRPLPEQVSASPLGGKRG